MRYLVGLLVVISWPVFGAPDDEILCRRSGTALDSIACAQPEWAASELQLQTEYDQLVEELKQLGSGHLVKDLIAAQRTWLKSREQYCDVYGRFRVEGNSWTSYWQAECLASEARSRAKSLKAMRGQDDSAEQCAAREAPGS